MAEIPRTTVRHNVGTCPACRDYLWAEVDIDVNVSPPTMTREGEATAYASPHIVGMRVAHSCCLDDAVTGVELHCDDCQQPYGVWFAENDVWNLVMGGPEAKGDPGGMLCPRCFTVRAEEVYQQTAIWRLVLDNPTRATPAASGTETEETGA